MMRVLLALFFMVFTLPAQAQNEPLSPSDTEIMYQENTLHVLNQIDMSDEVEHHASGADKGGLPQFDVTTYTSQLFWLGVAFILLYVFFAKKTLPAISSTIETRHSTIRNDIEAADKLSAQVEQLQQEYETAMNDARNNARAATAAVENESRELAEKQSADFREKSMAAIAAVESNAQAAKDKIRGELEDVTAELVQDIVTKLSPVKVTATDVKKAVQAELNNKSQPSSSKKAA